MDASGHSGHTESHVTYDMSNNVSVIISLAFRVLRSPRARMVPPVSITTMSSTSGKYWVEWVTNSLIWHFQLSREAQVYRNLKVEEH